MGQSHVQVSPPGHSAYPLHCIGQDIHQANHIRRPAKSEGASDQSGRIKSSVFLRLNGAADTAAARLQAMPVGIRSVSSSDPSPDQQPDTTDSRHEPKAAEPGTAYADMMTEQQSLDSDGSEHVGRGTKRRGRAQRGMASDALVAEQNKRQQPQSHREPRQAAPQLPSAKPLSAKQLCQMIGSQGQARLSSQSPSAPDQLAHHPIRGPVSKAQPAAMRDALSHDSTVPPPLQSCRTECADQATGRHQAFTGMHCDRMGHPGGMGAAADHATDRNLSSHMRSSQSHAQRSHYQQKQNSVRQLAACIAG